MPQLPASAPISVPSLRAAMFGALALFGLSACAPPPVEFAQPAPARVAPTPVEPVVQPGQFDPAGVVRIALLSPGGTGDAEREARATEIENGARLGVQDGFGVEIDLRVYPTSETPEGARAAAEAAIADGARLIVGPLFSQSALAVRDPARAAGVPVLTLSNNTDVAGQGVNILGVTFADAARRLLSHAAAQGVTRIGVIHTTDAEGLAARDAIRAAAPGTGASVIVEASYERSRNGIPEAAETFVTSMITAGVEGIIMTDRGSGLVYAASFLPFHGLDTEQVQIMALNSLAGEAFANERALMGAWFAEADPELAELFSLRYATAFGTEPGRFASLAYDGIVAVQAMLTDAMQTGDSTPFGPEDIASPLGFPGVTGVFRFQPDGTIDRGLAVRAVGRGGVETLSPAPPRFDALVN